MLIFNPPRDKKSYNENIRTRKTKKRKVSSKSTSIYRWMDEKKRMKDTRFFLCICMYLTHHRFSCSSVKTEMRQVVACSTVMCIPSLYSEKAGMAYKQTDSVEKKRGMKETVKKLNNVFIQYILGNRRKSVKTREIEKSLSVNRFHRFFVCVLFSTVLHGVAFNLLAKYTEQNWTLVVQTLFGNRENKRKAQKRLGKLVKSEWNKWAN